MPATTTTNPSVPSSNAASASATQPPASKKYGGFENYRSYHKAFNQSVCRYRNPGIKALLRQPNHGIDVNYSDFSNEQDPIKPPLIVAVQEYNVELVKFFLQFPGIDMHVKTQRGKCAYLNAVEMGNVSTVEAFLNAGVDPNTFYLGNALEYALIRISSCSLIQTEESEWFLSENSDISWDNPADPKLKTELNAFFNQAGVYQSESPVQGKPFTAAAGKTLCVRYHGNLSMLELLLAKDVNYSVSNFEDISPQMMVENPSLLLDAISGADRKIGNKALKSENQIIFQFNIKNRNGTAEDVPVYVLYDLARIQRKFKVHIANHPQRLARLEMRQAAAAVKEDLEEKTQHIEHNVGLVVQKTQQLGHNVGVIAQKTNHLEHNMVVVTDQVVASRGQIQAVASSVQHVEHNVGLVVQKTQQLGHNVGIIAQKTQHLEHNMVVVTDQVVANREQIQAVASSVQPLVEEHAEDLEWRQRRESIEGTPLRKLFCDALQVHLQTVLLAKEILASKEIERKQGDKEAAAVALLEVMGQHLPVFGAIFSIAAVGVQQVIDYQQDKVYKSFAMAFVAMDIKRFAGHLSIEVTQFLSPLFDKGLMNTKKQIETASERTATAVLYLLSLNLSTVSSMSHEAREVFLRSMVMNRLMQSPCMKKYQQQFIEYLAPGAPNTIAETVASSTANSYLLAYNQSKTPSPIQSAIPVAQAVPASTTIAAGTEQSNNPRQQKSIAIEVPAEEKKSASCCVIS